MAPRLEFADYLFLLIALILISLIFINSLNDSVVFIINVSGLLILANLSWNVDKC